MKNWIKKYLWIFVGIFLFVGIYSYYKIYLPYEHLKEGYVIVSGFDCPSDHPIKAHLGSMIFHVPGDPYYRKTSASNGDCFDTVAHAIKQGFRVPFNL